MAQTKVKLIDDNAIKAHHIDETATGITLAELSVSGGVSISGDLGIGTSLPDAPLHVYYTESVNLPGLLIENRNTGNEGRIKIGGTSGAGETYYAEIGYDGAGYLNFYNDRGLITEIASTPAMTIDSSGNLGIGTSNPQARLQIVNPTNQTTVPAAGTGATQGVIISNDLNSYGMFVGSTGDGKGYIQQQRTDTATYYDLLIQPNGGNVGIGITPTNTLHVKGSTGDLKLERTGYSNYIQLGMPGGSPTIVGNGGLGLGGDGAWSSHIIINTSGDVGIGTSLPQSKLHVAGNAIIDGALQVGGLVYQQSHYVNDESVGWHTIAVNSGNRAIARFGIRDTDGGDHQSIVFYASHHYGANSDITILHSGRYSGTPLRYIRIKEGGTYDGALLQVYVDHTSNSLTAYLLGDDFQSDGWTLVNWVPDGTDPGGVGNFSGLTNVAVQVDIDKVIDGGMLASGNIVCEGRMAVNSPVESAIFSLKSGDGYSGIEAMFIQGVSFNTAVNISYPYACPAFTLRSELSGGTAIYFYSSNTTPCGNISVNGTSTSYNTSSDYRLKENLAPITDGIDRLKLLEPKRFNFINDPNKILDGFVAHEVQDIVPEAVTGEKDGVDWKGEPEYQGIDQAKLVPLLTAALQEAVAKIEALEERITILENN